MTILMVGMQDSVIVFESSKTGWNSHESLKETNPQSIAFDPLNSGRAYCATFGNGLWITDDDGRTWSNIGKNVISSPNVMSTREIGGSMYPVKMDICPSRRVYPYKVPS